MDDIDKGYTKAQVTEHMSKLKGVFAWAESDVERWFMGNNTEVMQGI
jgi:hypothetical protein